MSVSSTIQGACGLAPETKDSRSVQSSLESAVNPFTVMAKVNLLWDNGSSITYSYFGGTTNQQAAVDLVAPEWTWFANLTLQRKADDDRAALIRITFDPNGGSWSSIGKGALRIKDGKPTMNLGWLADSAVISDIDRGTILHEWGHALGLLHEHQSPASGGIVILEPSKVYEYYSASQGWPNYLIKSHVLDVFNAEDVSNFSKLDLNSVMRYFMPGSMNKQGVDVNPNINLTDTDKAYAVINYTRSVPHDNAQDWTLQKALDVTGVPAADQKTFLTSNDTGAIRCFFAVWAYNARSEPYREPPRPALSSEARTSMPFEKSLSSQRPGQRESSYEPSQSEPEQPSLPLSATPFIRSQPEPFQTGSSTPPFTEHSLKTFPQLDLSQKILSALDHSTVRQAITNVIDVVLAPRGVNTRLISVQLVEVHNSIWSGIMADMKKPAFLDVLVKSVDSALTQHGLDISMVSAADSDEQTVILSGILDVINALFFREVVSAIVETAFLQDGVGTSPDARSSIYKGVFQATVENPCESSPRELEPPSEPSSSQSSREPVLSATFVQANFSNPLSPGRSPETLDLSHAILSALEHSTVHQAITDVIDVVLAPRGLNTGTIATRHADAYHTIWSVIMADIEKPAFFDVLVKSVNSALVERGLDASTIQATDTDVQSVILSGILGVINVLFFREVVSTIVETVFRRNGLDIIPVAEGSIFLSAVESPRESAPRELEPASEPSSSSQPSREPLLSAAFVQASSSQPLSPGRSPETLDLSHVILSVLEHSTVHQAITDVIDVVLAPRGLDTGIIATQHADAYHTIWSVIMADIEKPAFFDVLVKSVNSALVERGLDASTIQAADPDVQSVILSGILDVINVLFFREVVSTIVETVFRHNGLDILPVAQGSTHKDVFLSAVKSPCEPSPCELEPLHEPIPSPSQVEPPCEPSPRQPGQSYGTFPSQPDPPREPSPRQPGQSYGTFPSQSDPPREPSPRQPAQFYGAFPSQVEPAREQSLRQPGQSYGAFPSQVEPPSPRQPGQSYGVFPSQVEPPREPSPRQTVQSYAASQPEAPYETSLPQFGQLYEPSAGKPGQPYKVIPSQPEPPCESSPRQPPRKPFPADPSVQPETPQANPPLDLSQNIVSALDHSIVHREITFVIDAILVPRGLTKQIIATRYAEVYNIIWSGIMAAIRKPIFLDVLGKSVNSALAEHGLNTPTTQLAGPSVQSIILSCILDVIKNPFFRQVVATIVDVAFSLQNDVNNISDDQTSTHQQVLTNTTTESLTSRGINPHLALGEYNIQQSILSGITGAFRDPNFQLVLGLLVVGHAVDAALKEYEIQNLLQSLQRPAALAQVQNGFGNPQLMLTPPHVDIASQSEGQRAILNLAGNMSVDNSFSGVLGASNSLSSANTLLQSSISRSASPVNEIGALTNGFRGKGLTPQADITSQPDVQRALLDLAGNLNVDTQVHGTVPKSNTHVNGSFSGLRGTINGSNTNLNALLQSSTSPVNGITSRANGVTGSDNGLTTPQADIASRSDINVQHALGLAGNLSVNTQVQYTNGSFSASGVLSNESTNANDALSQSSISRSAFTLANGFGGNGLVNATSRSRSESNSSTPNLSLYQSNTVNPTYQVALSL
ncbi:hypothetical protein H0H92_015878 [Tricholoma furcatifolium]|nr:hypothetical protein H0H92_015878 [Tricholoma furcatifolium]